MPRKEQGVCAGPEPPRMSQKCHLMKVDIHPSGHHGASALIYLWEEEEAWRGHFPPTTWSPPLRAPPGPSSVWGGAERICWASSSCSSQPPSPSCEMGKTDSKETKEPEVT